MPGTVFVTDPSHAAHMLARHPERPERVEAIVAQLEARGLRQRLDERPARAATDEDLLTVHEPALLAAVDRAAARSGPLDADTYAKPESPAIARRSAGALLVAVEAVLSGDARNSFVATRPPGHHATATQAMGFCLFNNVAIAATAALRSGVGRLAILDWDVHHGNGTQATFRDDPRVLYVSTHASPFYPGTGEIHEVGGGAARGTNVNIPLPLGTGDAGFLAAWEHVGVPALERHRPELMLVSSGWDAHARDPLGTLNVTTEGYTNAARLVLDAATRLCEGRVVATLEGGYDTHALAWCASALVELLLGDEPTPDPEPAAVPPGDPLDALIEDVRRAVGL